MEINRLEELLAGNTKCIHKKSYENGINVLSIENHSYGINAFIIPINEGYTKFRWHYGSFDPLNGYIPSQDEMRSVWERITRKKTLLELLEEAQNIIDQMREKVLIDKD